MNLRITYFFRPFVLEVIQFYSIYTKLKSIFMFETRSLFKLKIIFYFKNNNITTTTDMNILNSVNIMNLLTRTLPVASREVLHFTRTYHKCKLAGMTAHPKM